MIGEEMYIHLVKLLEMPEDHLRCFACPGLSEGSSPVKFGQAEPCFLSFQCRGKIRNWELKRNRTRATRTKARNKYSGRSFGKQNSFEKAAKNKHSFNKTLINKLHTSYISIDRVVQMSPRLLLCVLLSKYTEDHLYLRKQ